MNIVNGVKNCEMIADLLNGIITSTGKAIDLDNQQIWAGFLHQRLVDNEFWADTLAAMHMIRREMPAQFRPFHVQALQDAQAAWDELHASHGRCMDTKTAKGKTWRLIMTIREVINNINEVSIPNG